MKALLLRVLRSGAAGAVATGIDLGTLTALVSFGGMTPRTANVPALVAGAAAMFVGQKYFAFASKSAHVGRELFWFAVIQAVGLALNALLYDSVLRFFPSLSPYFVVVRLVTSNIIWLGYSFPLWHLVFRAPRTGVAQDLTAASTSSLPGGESGAKAAEPSTTTEPSRSEANP